MMMMTSVRRELQCGEEWGGSSRENGMWRVGDQHADEVEGGWPGNLVLLLHQVGGSPAQLHLGGGFLGARSVSRPTLWLQDLWQGARGDAGGVADTIQTIFKSKVQLGRIYPAWRGPGDWRRRGIVWREGCGGHGRGQQEGQKPLRGGRF